MTGIGLNQAIQRTKNGKKTFRNQLYAV